MKKIGLSFLLLLLLSSFSPNDPILLIPDIGIKFGKDTFLLKITNPKSLADRLSIKETANIIGVQWSGATEEGNEVYGQYQMKTIKHNGIEFEFRGPKSDSLTLSCIYINPQTTPYDIILRNINLRQKPLELLKIFPNSQSESISGNDYSEHGVLFQTETINKTPHITLVSINSKYEKTK